MLAHACTWSFVSYSCSVFVCVTHKISACARARSRLISCPVFMSVCYLCYTYIYVSPKKIMKPKVFFSRFCDIVWCMVFVMSLCEWRWILRLILSCRDKQTCSAWFYYEETDRQTDKQCMFVSWTDRQNDSPNKNEVKANFLGSKFTLTLLWCDCSWKRKSSWENKLLPQCVLPPSWCTHTRLRSSACEKEFWWPLPETDSD